LDKLHEENHLEIGARLIVTPSRRRNDRRPDKLRSHKYASSLGQVRRHGDWLWGWHTLLAALENPNRQPPRRFAATAERARSLSARFDIAGQIEVMESAAISALLPQGVVHQGIAADFPPVEPLPLSALGNPASGVLVMLDQITDPQNVGAIFRSAAALGAHGVVLQDRNAPSLTGALAKAAAGAVDKLPHARETNLSRALERLDAMGWRAVGLDGTASETLQQVLDGRPTVLVVGSEGEGLRRLVREHCDALARIPMAGGFESLNVAAATAIALYEASRPR
jgi:23S rRNA (guanosine2251-2'-O)-methyltransferase